MPKAPKESALEKYRQMMEAALAASEFRTQKAAGKACDVSESTASRAIHAPPGKLPTFDNCQKVWEKLEVENREEIAELYWAAKNGRSVSSAHEDSGPPLPELIKNSLHIVSIDVTLNLAAERIYIDATRFVRATKPGVRQIRLGQTVFPVNGSVPTSKVTEAEGCTIIYERVGDSGGITMVAQFQEDIPTEAPHYSRFRIKRELDGKDMFPVLTYRPDTKTDLLHQRVLFDKSRMPTIVQVINGEGFSSAQDLIEGRELIEPSTDGLLELPERRRPQLSLSYGARWCL